MRASATKPPAAAAAKPAAKKASTPTPAAATASTKMKNATSAAAGAPVAATASSGGRSATPNGSSTSKVVSATTSQRTTAGSAAPSKLSAAAVAQAQAVDNRRASYVAFSSLQPEAALGSSVNTLVPTSPLARSGYPSSAVTSFAAGGASTTSMSASMALHAPGMVGAPPAAVLAAAAAAAAAAALSGSTMMGVPSQSNLGAAPNAPMVAAGQLSSLVTKQVSAKTSFFEAQRAEQERKARETETALRLQEVEHRERMLADGNKGRTAASDATGAPGGSHPDNNNSLARLGAPSVVAGGGVRLATMLRQVNHDVAAAAAAAAAAADVTDAAEFAAAAQAEAQALGEATAAAAAAGVGDGNNGDSVEPSVGGVGKMPLSALLSSAQGSSMPIAVVPNAVISGTAYSSAAARLAESAAVSLRGRLNGIFQFELDPPSTFLQDDPPTNAPPGEDEKMAITGNKAHLRSIAAQAAIATARAFAAGGASSNSLGGLGGGHHHHGHGAGRSDDVFEAPIERVHPLDGFTNGVDAAQRSQGAGVLAAMEAGNELRRLQQRLSDAATTMQSFVRMAICRSRYLRHRRVLSVTIGALRRREQQGAALVVQRWVRRHLARLQYLKAMEVITQKRGAILDKKAKDAATAAARKRKPGGGSAGGLTPAMGALGRRESVSMQSPSLGRTGDRRGSLSMMSEAVLSPGMDALGRGHGHDIFAGLGAPTGTSTLVTPRGAAAHGAGAASPSSNFPISEMGTVDVDGAALLATGPRAFQLPAAALDVVTKWNVAFVTAFTAYQRGAYPDAIRLFDQQARLLPMEMPELPTEGTGGKGGKGGKGATGAAATGKPTTTAAKPAAKPGGKGAAAAAGGGAAAATARKRAQSSAPEAEAVQPSLIRLDIENDVLLGETPDFVSQRLMVFAQRRKDGLPPRLTAAELATQAAAAAPPGGAKGAAVKGQPPKPGKR